MDITAMHPYISHSAVRGEVPKIDTQPSSRQRQLRALIADILDPAQTSQNRTVSFSGRCGATPLLVRSRELICEML